MYAHHGPLGPWYHKTQSWEFIRNTANARQRFQFTQLTVTSGEADTRSASHYRVHMNPPLEPIPSHMNPVHILSPHFLRSILILSCNSPHVPVGRVQRRLCLPCRLQGTMRHGSFKDAFQPRGLYIEKKEVVVAYFREVSLHLPGGT
jgi:hypothetical protein